VVADEDGTLSTSTLSSLSGNKSYILDISGVSDGDWITIAKVGDGTNNGGLRADALFELHDRRSSHHHTLVFRAGQKFRNGTYINVISSNWYAETRFTKIRIMDLDTYDGAVLQVQIDNSHINTGNYCYLTISENNNNQGWVSDFSETSTNTIVADNNPTVYVTDSPSTPGGTYTTAKEIDVTSDPNGSNSNWSTTQDVFIDGNVGIGAAPNATYKLFIDGKIKTTGITELSDVRYKKDINTIESALDKIKQLRGVTYEWKNPTLENNRNGLQSGLIAQEVELVIPSVVDTDVDGFKSVQYSHLVPYLIESIKELNATIEQLQLTNANKEQKIGQLRSEINQSTLDNQEMKDMILQLYEKLDLEFDEDGKVISKG